MNLCKGDVCCLSAECVFFFNLILVGFSILGCYNASHV